jgi:hypothetical protein
MRRAVLTERGGRRKRKEESQKTIPLCSLACASSLKDNARNTWRSVSHIVRSF